MLSQKADCNISFQSFNGFGFTGNSFRLSEVKLNTEYVSQGVSSEIEAVISKHLIAKYNLKPDAVKKIKYSTLKLGGSVFFSVSLANVFNKHFHRKPDGNLFAINLPMGDNPPLIEYGHLIKDSQFTAIIDETCKVYLFVFYPNEVKKFFLYDNYNCKG